MLKLLARASTTSATRPFRALFTTTMQEFQQRDEQAEQTIATLKKQLEILKGLAAAKRKQNEEAEIERLQKRNADLQADVNQLKADLKFYEVQNGVAQIPLPASTPPTVVTSTASKSTASNAATTPAPGAEAKPEQPKKQQAKKEKKKKEPKEAAPKPSAESEKIDISRLLFKVGKIVEVNKHPDADSLYVEKVDLGEGAPRTIVSGLVKNVTLEQMQDRIAVFCCNLKPAKMRGVLSQGMIMCASTPEKVEILEVPTSASVGDIVTCEGFPGEADAQLNPKKKIWEQVQPDLRVNAEGVPGYKGSPFTIVGKDGTFKAPTMKDCPIK